jgi:hypothetical protein
MTRVDLDSILASLSSVAGTAVQDSNAAFARLNAKLQLLNLGMGSAIAFGVLSSPQNTNFNLPVNFIPGVGRVSSLQFDFPLPTGFTFISAAAGPVLTGAGKILSTNMIGTTLRVLIYGGQAVLGQGSFCTITLKTDTTAGKRMYYPAITGIVASTPEGLAEVLSGVSGTITIT